MKTSELDKILDIVNQEKLNRGLENYAPCYPMLRVMDDKLYVAVMISNLKVDIWSSDSLATPEYWCLLDPNSYKILEFNQTDKKHFSDKTLSSSNSKNILTELEKSKQLEYEKYLRNEIANTEFPIINNLFLELNNKIIIDGKEKDIQEYLQENLEDTISLKAKEIVDLLFQSKYSLITIAYDNLFKSIINSYCKKNLCDISKIKLCEKIMELYYGGIIGIKEFFNI